MSGFPSRTASFPTRRQAERWAKTVEAEMIEGRHFRTAEARRRTVGAAIDRYIEEELPKKRDARNPRIRLLWWKQKIGDLKLSDVTPAVLVEYRGKLQRETFTRARPDSKHSTVKDGEAATFKRSGATVNRYLAALSKVFTVARKEWHWLSHNPFDGVSKHKEGKGVIRFLSSDERRRLLNQTAKNPQLHAFVTLALATAARAGELQQLTWGDVDLREGRLLLRKTKNGEARTAWVHGAALDVLKQHAKVRPIDDGERVFRSETGKLYRYEEDFAAACDAAEVKNFRFHDLRHTAATELAKLGATEQQLKAIGGWKSNVVSRYVHLAAEDARAIVEKMNEKILGGESYE